MEFLNLLDRFDNSLGDNKKNKQKTELLKRMVLIECKYNLDILNVINTDAIKENEANLSDIVKLLKTDALETLLFDENLAETSSVIFGKITAFIKKAVEVVDEEIKPIKINNDDPTALIIYKKISILKALSSIKQPNPTLIKINYKKRIDNLHNALLELNNIVGINKITK